MKVAMLSPNLPPRRCGVGDVAYRLAREIRDRGHEVVLLSCFEGDRLEGVETVVVPGERWNPGHAARLAREVKKLRAEILHYHYVPFLYGKRGLSLGASLLPMLMRREGVPVVTTLHELAMPWMLSPGRLAVATVHRLQLAMLVAGSGAILVTTGHRERKLRAWFPWKDARLYRVPVGATMDVEPSVEARTVRQQLAADGQVILGFLGTVHPSKDIRLVARCVAMLATEGVKARLLLIGPERHELEALLGDAGRETEEVLEKMLFTGWVSHQEVSRLLSAVDILLLPFVDGVSTLRTTTMAALAHGLAVVGTRGRETDGELLDSGMWLVPAGDEAAFCEAVATLARDPERRVELGARGRDFQQRHYSWPRLAELTLVAYEAARAVRQEGTAQGGRGVRS